MKKIACFFTALVTLAMSLTSFAQNLTVRGTVTDASNGEPVSGAVVRLAGNATAYALTDVGGRYEISSPGNATLVVSCLGYVEHETPISGRTIVNVSLRPDAEALEGTVVVGYGSARKIGNIVGSVTTVTYNRKNEMCKI